MTIDVDAAALARLQNVVRGVIWLVEMDFGTGTVRYTNAPINLTIGGQVFSGYASIAGISVLGESESNSAEKVTFTFSAVNQAILASTLGNVENYRGKPVRLYLQMMNERFRPDGAPVKRWAGYMDKVAVSRTRSDTGVSTGKIEMACSRAGMARARTYQGRRLTNPQQQQRFPGDRGLEYMQKLIEQPARWLSKKFQEI